MNLDSDMDMKTRLELRSWMFRSGLEVKEEVVVPIMTLFSVFGVCPI